MANTTKKGKASRRLDKNRLTLRKGETQRKDGTYDFRWTSADGKRHSVYASTLEELREKEEAAIRDKQDGIKTETRRVTVNDVFELWCDLKRGLKHNTFTNYKYMYNMFVRPSFGKLRIASVKNLMLSGFITRLQMKKY